MNWISNLPWAAFAKQKCILLSDYWFNPILYNFFIQIPYLPYSQSKTNVCISVGACVFNILAVLFDCHVMGHFGSTLFGPFTQREGNGNASLCDGWFWQQGFHHKKGSRPVSQTIGIGENMIQITFNGTQTLQKNYWYLNHTHLFACHFMGFSQCFRHMNKSAPSQVVHEMATRRNDKSSSVLVWLICWAAQQPTRPMWCQMPTAHWTSKASSSSRCHLHQVRHRCRKPVDSKRERICVDTTHIHTMKCQQFRAITWTAFESSIWLAYIYWRVL